MKIQQVMEFDNIVAMLQCDSSEIVRLFNNKFEKYMRLDWLEFDNTVCGLHISYLDNSMNVVMIPELKYSISELLYNSYVDNVGEYVETLILPDSAVQSDVYSALMFKNVEKVIVDMASVFDIPKLIDEIHHSKNRKTWDLKLVLTDKKNKLCKTIVIPK